MNAIELLKSQHDEVEELFKQIEAAEDSETKENLFDDLADKLAAHAAIEEKIFYPAVMAKQTKDLLLESAEEHLAIKRVLADLLELDPAEDEFDAKIAVVREQVEHHAREEEEGELFPKVRQLLGADELEGLGGEMSRMFEELIGDNPRLDIPNQTGRAASI